MPRKKLNKPYYCIKGKYSAPDLRNRIVIREDGNKEIVLPKPEVLKEILQELNHNFPELIGMCKRRLKFRGCGLN